MFHFLSNFAPSKVKFEGETYPTVEHAFQAAKTSDKAERSEIRNAPSAGVAKKLGGKVKLRRDWESVKVSIMENLLRQKFSSEHHKKWLLDTETQVLVEGNTWHDNFWGVCHCSRCDNGKNNLGMLLMKIRTELSEANK